MKKHEVLVKKTARYYTIGNVKSAKEVWIVLHGYAQLASTFIQRFEDIKSDKLAIVAPEGLHRFYQKGFYGDVVASWMTKEERESDISDYVNYLNNVAELVTNSTQKITVFGFSQGVATACRWIAEGSINIQNLILWAGTFPIDINLKRAQANFPTLNCYLVYDEQDPFRNDDSWKEQLLFIETIGVKPIFYKFSGGHRIPKAVLKRFFQQYF